LAVSFVDPVQIEVAAGFRLLRGFEFTPVFGLAMNEPVGVGAQFVLPFFGSLAGNS